MGVLQQLGKSLRAAESAHSAATFAVVVGFQVRSSGSSVGVVEGMTQYLGEGGGTTEGPLPLWVTALVEGPVVSTGLRRRLSLHAALLVAAGPDEQGHANEALVALP
jgi:hypothetical protein